MSPNFTKVALAGYHHWFQSLLDARGVMGCNDNGFDVLPRAISSERTHDRKARNLEELSSPVPTSCGTMTIRRGYGPHPYRVIALDCDNTSWNGIYGKTLGASPVAADACRRVLQSVIREQSEQGMLRFCTRSNKQDVFETNPGMLLKRKDITAHSVNWQKKPAGIKALSEKPGPDSSVFIGDYNPGESAAMQAEWLQVPMLSSTAATRELMNSL